MIKVLIFGAMPPPIGGVSIHIERFLHFVKEYEPNIDVSVYDIKKQSLTSVDSQVESKKIVFSLFLSADIIHIHISNNFKIFIALISKLFKKKVIYTHHNSRIKSKFWFNTMNYLSDIVILVNDKEIDIKKLNLKKIRHIPAFLPPYKFKELPNIIDKKINQSKFVISTNCFQYTEFNNKDLYGFDLIISAYGKLIEEKKLKDSLLILVDPSNTTLIYVEELIKKFSCLNSSNILYVNEAIDFSSLIKKSNLTLRATRSDGDSLSVRESLYFGVPIIASDVTYRPLGTEVFENENILDLKNKILKVYNQKKSLSINNVEHFADTIIEVYKSVIKTQNKGKK